MKKGFVVLVWVMLVSLVCVVPSYAADKVDAVKIGVVDMQKVLFESKGGKDAKVQFENEMAGKKRAFTEKEEILKKLRSEMDKAGISDAEKKEKEEKFQKEAREMRRMREETEAGLREMDKAIAMKMVGEIRDVISKVGEEGKYTIILEKNASVLYMPDTIDLTGKVIENYDKQKAKK
jgi:outer membrane protein